MKKDRTTGNNISFQKFQNNFKILFLSDYDILLQEAKQLNWSSERILGLKELPKRIDNYFKIFENINISKFEEKFINLFFFESVKLKNEKIVRASVSFYHASFYSDICMHMPRDETLEYERDDEKYYGKVKSIKKFQLLFF